LKPLCASSAQIQEGLVLEGRELRAANGELFVVIFVVLYVLLDKIRRDIAGADTEESARPQVLSPVPFAELGKFLLEFSRACAFHKLDQLTDGQVGRV